MAKAKQAVKSAAVMAGGATALGIAAGYGIASRLTWPLWKPISVVAKRFLPEQELKVTETHRRYQPPQTRRRGRPGK